MKEGGNAEVYLPVTFPNGVKMNVLINFFFFISIFRLELILDLTLEKLLKNSLKLLK